MKIAFVVRNYHKSGGISRCAAELAEKYSKNDELHVFTASWRDVDSSKIIFHKVPMLSFPALKNHKLTALNNIFEIASFAFFSYFMVKPDNFDIVHSHGSYVGRSDIFTTHSCHAKSLSISRQSRKGFWGKLKKTILNPLHALLLLVEALALRNSKKIIAVSETVKNEVMELYGISDRRIEAVPNGVSLEKFLNRNNISYRAAIREKHGFKTSDKVILFPAHEYERKGLRQLIEALNAIQDKNLYVLTVGHDDPAPFVPLIKKYGLEKNFVFAGNVPRIQEYFAAADLMALPTYYEPFGLVILEAMAAGLPVIATKCAGASGLITDNFNGLLLEKYNDTQALAWMLTHYANNTEAARSAGENAHKTALLHSWDIIAAKTYKVYEELLLEKAYEEAFAVRVPAFTSFSWNTRAK